MEVTLLVKTVLGFFAILILVILVFVIMFTLKKKEKEIKKKQERKKKKKVVKEDTSFEHLRKVIRRQVTTAQELKKTLDLIIKHYGVIPKKQGIKPHPEFKFYAELMIVLCIHQNTNKTLISTFDKELNRLNPQYKKELNEALMKGLSAR